MDDGRQVMTKAHIAFDKVSLKCCKKANIKDCSFRPDPFTNMAATGHSCF
jgi:hypothetical protein